MEIIKTGVGLKCEHIYKINGVDYPGIVIEDDLIVVNKSLEDLVLYTKYMDKTNPNNENIVRGRAIDWDGKKLPFENFIRLDSVTTFESKFYPFLDLTTPDYEDGWILIYDKSEDYVSKRYKCVKVDKNRSIIHYGVADYQKEYGRPFYEMLIPAIIILVNLIVLGVFGLWGLILTVVTLISPLVVQFNFNGSVIKYSGVFLNRKSLTKIETFNKIPVYLVDDHYYLFTGDKLVPIADDDIMRASLDGFVIEYISNDLKNKTLTIK